MIHLPRPDGWVAPTWRESTTIPSLLVQQATRHGDRPAVLDGPATLTYRQLARRAWQVARAIAQSGAPSNDGAAVLLRPGSDLIVAILGAGAAGKFWVPLDPLQPPARLGAILEDADANVILTNGRDVELARALAGGRTRIVDLDALGTPADNGPPPIVVRPEHIAHVLYTSGSEGTPKGVVHTHLSATQAVWSQSLRLFFTSEDRLALLASHTFVACITGILRALMHGAAIAPYPLGERGIAPLARWLRDERITVLHTVPSVFRRMTHGLDPATRFPAMRLVHLGGEPVLRRDVEVFRRHFPRGCHFLSNFGSTETATVTQFLVDHEVDLRDEVVPVGHAVPGKEVLLLDENSEAVPHGAIGEIVVRSPYLARGYWRDEERSRRVFRTDDARPGWVEFHTGDLGRFDADGCLHHLGRRDGRLKVRGQRVEPGDVEAALMAHPQVREAAVRVWQNERGEFLAGYFTVAGGASLDEDVLRSFLRERLPRLMVPTVLVRLDSLPRGTSGKVDRRRLPAPHAHVGRGNGGVARPGGDP